MTMRYKHLPFITVYRTRRSIWRALWRILREKLADLFFWVGWKISGGRDRI